MQIFCEIKKTKDGREFPVFYTFVNGWRVDLQVACKDFNFRVQLSSMLANAIQSEERS